MKKIVLYKKKICRIEFMFWVLVGGMTSLFISSCSEAYLDKHASKWSWIPQWRVKVFSENWDSWSYPDNNFYDSSTRTNFEELNEEDIRMSATKSLLGRFYADLYAPKKDWTEFTKKYSGSTAPIVLNAIKEKYAMSHGGKEGYDWSVFGGNVEDSSEVKKVSIFPARDEWLMVKICGADTTRFLISTCTDGSITGIINPKKHIAMDWIIDGKVDFLNKFYQSLYANHNDHKRLNQMYCDVITLKVAKMLRRSYVHKHLKGKGYDWGLFTEGLDDVSKECPKLHFSFEGGEWYAVKTATGQPTGLQIRVEESSTDMLMLITGLRKVTPMQTKI